MRYMTIVVAAVLLTACVGDEPTGRDIGQDAAAQEGGDAEVADANDGSHDGSHDAEADAGVPLTGLVAVAFAAPGSPPSACGADFPQAGPILHDGLSVASPSCDCSCGDPTQVACTLTIYGSTTCTSNGTSYCPSGSVISFAMTSSAPKTYAGAEGCIGNTATAFASGMCVATPAFKFPAPTWTGEATTCTPATPATPSKLPGSAFKICQATAGIVECPADHPERHIEYSGVADSRACSACTCGSPTGVSCGGAATVGSQTMPAAYACASGPATGYLLKDGSWSYTPAPTGGSCSQKPGTASGDVTPSDPTTFCCSG